MTLAPLLEASLPIRLHAAAALAALALCAHQFVRPRGTPGHRAVGYAWIGLMAATALSSFWIHKPGAVGSFGVVPFSAIHLLSIFVLVMLVRGVWAARSGRIEAHRRTMRGLVLYGLIGAGLFTLAPGRIMHAVLLGP